MGLFAYQQAALDRVSGKRTCAFYHDMGLGKTFTDGPIRLPAGSP
nr:MAG TPA: putative ATP-dependent RNA helicase [Caudoviricetes sp.]